VRKKKEKRSVEDVIETRDEVVVGLDAHLGQIVAVHLQRTAL